jgi:hypothetical protein
VFFFDGFVKYGNIRSSVVGSSINYYGPVIVFIFIIIIITIIMSVVAAAMCVVRFVFRSCVFVLVLIGVCAAYP